MKLPVFLLAALLPLGGALAQNAPFLDAARGPTPIPEATAANSASAATTPRRYRRRAGVDVIP